MHWKQRLKWYATKYKITKRIMPDFRFYIEFLLHDLDGKFIIMADLRRS